MKQLKNYKEQRDGTLAVIMNDRTSKNEAGVVYVTESVATKDAALDAKMKQVEPKLLGIKMVNYHRSGLRKVWVPYYFLVYNYEVSRNVFFNKSDTFKRKGTVAVVYDVNEMHASHYDLIAEGEIPMVKKNIEQTDGEIMPGGGNAEEVMANAERSIQRQILWKAYKTEGELRQVQAVKFYREAWEITLNYKDRVYKKYAYLDRYGVHNERARGLKARLDNM